MTVDLPRLVNLNFKIYYSVHMLRIVVVVHCRNAQIRPTNVV